MACSRKNEGGRSPNIERSACGGGVMIRAACNRRRGRGIAGTRQLICQDQPLSCRPVFGLSSRGVGFGDQRALRRGLADQGQGSGFGS